ncbi:17951_t:CDS:2 [Gigaspora margarita]|uniref:17951_t:CDS:1 n=1 Tax=Gigaspora margarita TaxID=4874 RepID=A0ABN7VJJ0_GIGMA|nr:17951_t:CDS:2 [Gigaspora margarita]
MAIAYKDAILSKNKFIEEQAEGTSDNELDDTKAVAGEIEIEDNLLENAKKDIFEC